MLTFAKESEILFRGVYRDLRVLIYLEQREQYQSWNSSQIGVSDYVKKSEEA
jgi:hypothetical protein